LSTPLVSQNGAEKREKTVNTKAISGMLGTIHGELRWIFALVAVIGILRTMYGLVRDKEFSNLDSRWALAYSILLDLQALYGILLILYLSFAKLDGLRATFNWVGLHPVWMLAAVVVGHLGSRWKDAPDRQRFQVQLAIYLVSFALIFIGVITSPLRGWQ
jgi:hypothetical protein